MLDNNADNGVKKKSVKYMVKTTCWWNEKLWRADSVVEIPESQTPPKEHFSKL